MVLESEKYNDGFGKWRFSLPHIEGMTSGATDLRLFRQEMRIELGGNGLSVTELYGSFTLSVEAV